MAPHNHLRNLHIHRNFLVHLDLIPSQVHHNDHHHQVPNHYHLEAVALVICLLDPIALFPVAVPKIKIGLKGGRS